MVSEIKNIIIGSAGRPLMDYLDECPELSGISSNTDIVELDFQQKGESRVEECDGCVAGFVIVAYWPNPETGQEISSLFLDSLKENIAANRGVIVLEAPDSLKGYLNKDEVGSWNEALKEFADYLGAHFVPIRSKFLRWGLEKCLDDEYLLSGRGAKAASRSVAKIIAREIARFSLNEEALDLTTLSGKQSLKKLLANDPAAADELVLSMISELAGRLPDFLFTDIEKDHGRLLNNRHYEAAQAFQQGSIRMLGNYNWPDIPFGDPVDWTMTGPDRSWQSLFLGLEFLRPPLLVWWGMAKAEAQNSNKGESADMSLDIDHALDPDKLLLKSLHLALTFFKDNPIHAPQVPRTWHEGTVCRRLMSILFLLCCLVRGRHLVPPGSISRVALEIARINRFLADETHYIKAGNHGLRQDFLLYTTGRLLNLSHEGATWRDVALERLQVFQMDQALSADGVWLEHSTNYHVTIMWYLEKIGRVAQISGDNPGHEAICSHLNKMAPFLMALKLPESYIPMIGDTGPGAKTTIYAKISSYSNLSFSPPQFSMFPDAGYMICRPGTNSDINSGTYLVFYCNLRNAKHKHADDLSIFLQQDQNPWLIDGGEFNKEVSDKLRNFVRFDPASHNTYRVNGRGYPFQAKTAHQVGFVTTRTESDWAAATGVNRLYQGASVQRTVYCLPEYRLVVAMDYLLADEQDVPALFEQFWHLAPGLRIVPCDVGFMAAGDDRASRMTIAVDPNGEDEWGQREGGDDSPLGWMMTGWSQAVPCPVLWRKCKEARRWCVTAFRLSERSEPSIPKIEMQPVHGNGMSAKLLQDNKALVFSVDEKGNPELEFQGA